MSCSCDVSIDEFLSIDGTMTVPEEKEQPRFDVYARPFVPQFLRSINKTAANIVACAPVRWINFGEYVQSFAGSDYLPGNIASTRQSTGQTTPAVSETTRHESSRTPTHHDGRLTAENYHAYFLTALEDEKAAQQRECEDNTLFRVPVNKSGLADPRPSIYTLHVPGLREMSLRIETGDVVQLRQLRFTNRGEIIAPPMIRDVSGNAVVLPRHAENQYDAVVWGIDRRNEVLSLRVDHMNRMSMLFNVCFTVQTARMKALRHAVTAASNTLTTEMDEAWMRSILFPESADGYYQKTLNKAVISLELYDELLNYEQVKAVNTVLNESYGPVPFIISGPPGTGKTKTIVELALQKVSDNISEHLLLCAPSDPAADTLVQRLSNHLGPRDLLRINSPSRSFPEVPGNVLPYCHVDDGMFSLPSFKDIMSRRIVVTTCRDADVLIKARLSNADLFRLEQALSASIHPDQDEQNPALHWTGLLIDEAAQATEPEALIPLGVVAPPNVHSDEKQWPKFVMAGDQHQLGPRTASKSASIQTSLFERLLNRSFYCEHPLARSKTSGGVMRPLTQEMLPILRPAFANLIRNYRSHPAILATSSSLFYNDTLEPEATVTDSLLSWPGWKRDGWPVLFTNNSFQDEVEQDGGGWYNVLEAKMACNYAKSFLVEGLLHPHEICIMSPFQAQVKLVRRFARENSMSGVNIGPLEAFQGLESKLVIICTTRTRDRFIDQDIAKGLGVIHEPKRFNVALTRAKEGLIVIGNQDVLRQDENWSAFLGFCTRNGLVEGFDIKEDLAKNGNNAVRSRLEKQLLHRMENQEAAADGAESLLNGVRRLGYVEDAEEMIWKSGVATEASLSKLRNGETAPLRHTGHRSERRSNEP